MARMTPSEFWQLPFLKDTVSEIPGGSDHWCQTDLLLGRNKFEASSRGGPQKPLKLRVGGAGEADPGDLSSPKGARLLMKSEHHRAVLAQSQPVMRGCGHQTRAVSL